jgi:hypothetical protein
MPVVATPARDLGSHFKLATGLATILDWSRR